MKSILLFITCLLHGIGYCTGNIFITNDGEHYDNSFTNIIESKIRYDGRLTWTSVNEPKKVKYQIEHFVWQKWTIVGEIKGEGKDTNYYECKIEPFMFLNKVRIKVVAKGEEEWVTPVMKFYSEITQTSVPRWFVKDELLLPAQVNYAIFDSLNHKLIEGEGKKVDVSNLEQGTYFVHFEDIIQKFVKE